MEKMSAEELVDKGCILCDDLHKYGEALNCFQMALKLDKNCYAAIRNIGLVFHKLERYADAVLSYETYLNIDSNDIDIIINCGAILCDVYKDYSAAYELFRRALKIDSKNEIARGNEQICSNLWLIRSESSHKNILPQDYKSVENKHAVFLFLESHYHNNNSNSETALERLDQALEIEPGFVDAIGFKASLLFGKLEYEESLIIYKKYLDYTPNNHNAWYMVGSINVLLGHNEDALEAFDNALRINKRDSDAWFSKGLIEKKLGLKKEAIKSFKSFLKYADSEDSLRKTAEKSIWELK